MGRLHSTRPMTDLGPLGNLERLRFDDERTVSEVNECNVVVVGEIPASGPSGRSKVLTRDHPGLAGIYLTCDVPSLNDQRGERMARSKVLNPGYPSIEPPDTRSRGPAATRPGGGSASRSRLSSGAS